MLRPEQSAICHPQYNLNTSTATLITGGIACDSPDCGIWYERRKTWHELTVTTHLTEAGLCQLEDAMPFDQHTF